MAKVTLRLKPFDRNQDFTARKPMRVQGRDFLPGDPFDKKLVSTRRLRQLYEWRRVVTTAEWNRHHTTAPLPAPVPAPVDPVEIPEDWRSRKFLAMKAVARQIDPDLSNKAKKADVIATIEAELARRAAEAGSDNTDDAPAGLDADPSTITPVDDPSNARTAEPRSEQRAVEIPEDWRDLPWSTLRSLASKVSDAPINTKDDAVAAVDLELERRQAEADGQPS